MITFQQLGRLGRFGNQLFQIAGTIGIARKHGYDFGFPEWVNHDHKDRFGSSEDCDIQKYFVNPLPQSLPIDFPNLEIPWGYSNSYIPDNVSLHGHMQSEKYFKHCIDEVRHYLRMKDEPKGFNMCGIHIRRGDYDDQYHPKIGQGYYRQAIAQMPLGTTFIVFSDAVDEVLPMIAAIPGIEYGYNLHARYEQDYIKDFAFLKACNHFICANSSFSLMAAILSEAPNKKIVCPSNWFGPAWGSCYKEMAKDIYPENCIVI